MYDRQIGDDSSGDNAHIYSTGPLSLTNELILSFIDTFSILKGVIRDLYLYFCSEKILTALLIDTVIK